MQPWVVIVSLILVSTQLYEWVVQATVPFWLYGVAGLVLAIASNQKPTLTAAPMPKHEGTDVESESEPSQAPPISEAKSISFTVQHKAD